MMVCQKAYSIPFPNKHSIKLSDGQRTRAQAEDCSNTGNLVRTDFSFCSRLKDTQRQHSVLFLTLKKI